MRERSTTQRRSQREREGEGMGSEPTRILMGVNESSIKGYPHASISSRTAFEWTLEKIVRTNVGGFKLLFVHIQIPDEDGTLLFDCTCSVTRILKPDFLVLQTLSGKI